LEIHHQFFHCKPTGVRNQQVGAEDGRELDAMVDAQRNLVVWRWKEVAEWRMDSREKLRTLAGAAWDPGMDWLGGLAMRSLARW